MKTNAELIKLHADYSAAVGGTGKAEVASSLVLAHVFLELRDKIDEVLIARDFSQDGKLKGMTTVADIANAWYQSQGSNYDR